MAPSQFRWKGTIRATWDDNSYEEWTVDMPCDTSGAEVVNRLLALVPEPWEHELVITVDSYLPGGEPDKLLLHVATARSAAIRMPLPGEWLARLATPPTAARSAREREEGTNAR